jgi:hypothetical protein
MTLRANIYLLHIGRRKSKIEERKVFLNSVSASLTRGERV